MNNFSFKNKHLTIREIKESDFPCLNKYYFSDNYLFADFKANNLKELFTELMKSKYTTPRQYYIFIIESGIFKDFSGFFSLYIDNHKNYMVNPPLFEGLISLAIKNNFYKFTELENIITTLLKYFNSINIFHKFSVILDPESIKNGNIFSHIGFKKEGTLKDYALIDTGWADRNLFSLLAKDIK